MRMKPCNRSRLFVCCLAAAMMTLMGLCCTPALAGEEPIVVADQGADTSEATGMLLLDGMAQPVFKYTETTSKGYTNASSDLYRFAVFVETDYDTDRDGKYDLVKAYVQVPRAAVEGSGDYRAPVVFAADPYSAGQMLNGSYLNTKGRRWMTPRSRIRRGLFAVCRAVP